MAEIYTLKSETLINIADAIRLKRGITDDITPEDMPMQIGLIPSGGGSVFTYLRTITIDTDTVTTTDFYNLYMKPNLTTDALLIFMVKGNTNTTNTAGVLAGILNGSLPTMLRRNGWTNVVTGTSYNFYITAGATADIYSVAIGG